MSLDTVVFDLGNVLIGWDPRNLYRDLIADAAEREDFLTRVCSPAWNEEQDSGRTWKDAVELLVAEHPQHRALIEAYDHSWQRMLSGPIEGTVRLLERLEARGVPLYALTNWSQEKFRFAREGYPFLVRFRGILVSGEEKMRKPEPRIFERLLDKFGLRAPSTLFIDDSAANIATARTLGFATHLFTQPELLERQLVEAGLL